MAYTNLVQRFLPGAAIVLVNLLAATSPYIGDTMVCVDSVIRARTGQTTPGDPFSPLWEFGHLLWRPLGALVAPLALAIVPGSLAVDDRVKVAYGFLALSMLAGLGSGALVYDLSRRLAGWRAAALLTFGLAWANAFLMYSLAGHSYIAGLFFSIAAIWTLFGGMDSARRQAVSGLLASLAAAFWFPYVLTIPALAILPWAWERRAPRDGLRAALRVATAAGVCLAAVYLAGAAAAGVRTPADAVAWYKLAAHDWSQTQQWKRAATGIPRLLLDLSRDGALLKRYVLRDPFQTISLWDLAKLSLWKLAAFYLFIAGVVWMAWRSGPGRAALTAAATGAVPMLLFALVIFEPSSPERFLPLLPFLLLMIAAGWNASKAGRWTTTAFLLALPLINGQAFIESWSDQPAKMAAQIADAQRHAAPNDLLVTVTFSDPFPQWVEQRIFHPSMRKGAPPTYQLIVVASVNAGRWRERFAGRALQQWAAGGQVWIRRGALESRPDPMLQWTEGDNPALRWTDVPAFLRRFDYDRVTDRTDGFTRLAMSDTNRQTLQAIAAGN